jgi:hypothetical protein
VQTIILSLIRLYRAVFSPWFGNQCRFYPTCSVYAEEAISAHGSVKGSWLALKRTGKCHPWNAGGIDLVPPNNKMKENHG